MARVVVVCLGLTALGLPAGATTMVRMELGEVAQESHALVLVDVGRSSNIDGERMVYTDTELEVVDVLGGTAPSSMVVRQAGGWVGERRVVVPGDAELSEGQRIVAFVRKIRGTWYFTALGQSVWYASEDGLRPAIDTEHLMERDGSGAIVKATQSPQWFEDVASLRRATRGLAFGGAL